MSVTSFPNIPHKPGVYLIKNIITNKIYIGSSSSDLGIRNRFQVHRSFLKNNKHANKKLQNSWNKYGESNFTFEVIELCPKEVAIEKEQYYINKFNPEFNIRKIASSNLGLRHTKEMKKKLSEKTKNKYQAVYIKERGN